VFDWAASAAHFLFLSRFSPGVVCLHARLNSPKPLFKL
jgi:hypothetical protein